MAYRTTKRILTSALLLAAAAALAQGELQTYRVAPGEGLDAVARRFHTDRRTLQGMNELPPSLRLSAGQVLFVPAQTGATDVVVPAEPKPAPSPIVRKPAPARPRPTVRRQAPRPTPPVAAPHRAAPKAAVAMPVRPAPVRPAAPAHPAAKEPSAKPFLADYQDPQKSDGDMPVGRVIFDLVWKLAVVLGIAYGSLWLLRGLMNKQGVLPGRKGHLKVLESASLGPNRSIHLVQVGGKVIVVGSTNDQITTLGEVEDLQTLEEVSKDGPRGFAEHLGEAEAAGPDVAQEVRGGVRHLWEQVQEIRGLRPRGGGR